MNFLIQMVFFVAICAAVFPGSSAVPVDEDGQEAQAIMMRADSESQALEDELDAAQICTKCLQKCRWVPNKTECSRDCRQYSC